MPHDLDETQRRTIFAAVVAAQDRGLSVADSRQLVCDEMGVTVEQVRAAELEGLRKGWPPLGD
jgi:hypothetical protein